MNYMYNHLGMRWSCVEGHKGGNWEIYSPEGNWEFYKHGPPPEGWSLEEQEETEEVNLDEELGEAIHPTPQTPELKILIFSKSGTGLMPRLRTPLLTLNKQNLYLSADQLQSFDSVMLSVETDHA